MNICVVGLGKMGRIIAKKLSIKGIKTQGYDSDHNIRLDLVRPDQIWPDQTGPDHIRSG